MAKLLKPILHYMRISSLNGCSPQYTTGFKTKGVMVFFYKLWACCVKN